MNLNFQKFWKKRSVTITEYDPTFKVVYLGNVLTAWAKGEGCTDKPLATLWKNYCQNAKADVVMKVTVGNSGLKAVTKEHGLTEYWANRITYCAAPIHYPKVFCWVYRHEGKRLRQELRCHAVLCPKGERVAYKMAAQLQMKLTESLQEFRREKISRQNARLSLANSVYDNPSLPRRKILLCTGSANYRPPVERSKSAPKLTAIEESIGEDLSNKSLEGDQSTEIEQQVQLERLNSGRRQNQMRVQFDLSYSKHYDTTEEIILNGSIERRHDDPLNGNELDDIEVCLFDPTGRTDDNDDDYDDNDNDDDDVNHSYNSKYSNNNRRFSQMRLSEIGDDFSFESTSITSSTSTDSPTSVRGCSDQSDESGQFSEVENGGVSVVGRDTLTPPRNTITCTI